MGISMIGKKPSRRILSSSPSAASPPPDYPGLEYPPVFEPETYTLSDASSLLRSRQQSHDHLNANIKLHTTQSHNNVSQNWVWCASKVANVLHYFDHYIYFSVICFKHILIRVATVEGLVRKFVTQINEALISLSESELFLCMLWRLLITFLIYGNTVRSNTFPKTLMHLPIWGGCIPMIIYYDCQMM
jgi:hypothetical protein